MNLVKNRHNHMHRGLVGLEAAIVLMAFVIVAAAISFIVLNTGGTITQEAKTTIGSTFSSAGGSLVVEGKVVGSSYLPSGGTPSLNITSIPIKISSVDKSVSLEQSITAVKYQSNIITYDNIYNGTLNAKAKTTYINMEAAINAAATYDTAVGGKIVSKSPFLGGCGVCDPSEPNSDDWPAETTAFIYWTVQSNTNNILENGEHANLVIIYAAQDRPEYLDKIRVEVIQADGATLTVDRAVPVIWNQVVDLG